MLFRPLFKHAAFGVIALGILMANPFSARALTNLTASVEACIQGGGSANTDVDEVTANYLHVKYYTTVPMDAARKVYFQFNLGGASFDPDASAVFTIYFANTYQQRVQLWGLNQSAAISSNLTWNLAPANETNSNNMLTNGAVTATRIGGDALVPTSGTTPYTFTISRLGDFVFSNRVTLVLTGVADAQNNSAGLRMARAQASLTLGTVTNAPSTGDFDVYLAGGQSNMDGRGMVGELTNSLAIWKQPQSDVRIYYVNPGTNTTFTATPEYETGWQVLATGFSDPPGFSGALPSGDFGPELSFGRTMADADPNRRIAIIKVSKSGVNLASNWNPSGGYMYVTFTNAVRNALAALTNSGSSYTLRGMIWLQGESDSSGTSETNYETNLTRLILTVRRDFGVTNLPFVVGEIETNRVTTVRQSQFNVSQNLPYVGFASSDGLRTYEGTHFITADVLEYGRRFAAGLEVPPLVITNSAVKNGAIIFGFSGLGASRCTLLCQTNIAAPLANWTAVATNTLDAAGRGSFTNPLPASAQQFYRLRGN